MKKGITFNNLEELTAVYPQRDFGKASDLTNKKFGRLTPLFRVNRNDTYWACRCDCGKFIICRANHLTAGSIQSCGCYFSEIQKTIDKKWKPNHEDLSGEKFGYLTPIKMIGRDGTGKAIWECQCDCGSVTSVSASHLKTGHTRSCGCKKTSQYEEKVIEWLDKKEIEYKREIRVEELGLLRFDFQIFIKDFYIFVEIQGQQHYKPSSLFGGEEAFRQLQINDNKKKEYCKKHNIPLLEIKYSDNFEEKLEKIFQLESSTTNL